MRQKLLYNIIEECEALNLERKEIEYNSSGKRNPDDSTRWREIINKIDALLALGGILLDMEGN